MKVLSLFDGIACGKIALDRLCIDIDTYYASEIDKYSIAVTKERHPDIIHLGDINNWRERDIPRSEIDILFAGFSCQSWSNEGKQLGDEDPRGELMWRMIEIKEHILKQNPSMKFLFENVQMKKGFEEYVNKAIGVEPIKINSALVSAQNRKRLYRTNINYGFIPQPKDRGIVLKDILEDEVDKKYYVDNDFTIKGHTLQVQEATKKGYVEIPPECGVDLTRINSKTRRGRKMKDKSNCLPEQYTRYSWRDGYRVRKLTPVECERLQTLPDNYTLVKIKKYKNGNIKMNSDTQRYKQCGNGRTVEVIKHILSFL